MLKGLKRGVAVLFGFNSSIPAEENLWGLSVDPYVPGATVVGGWGRPAVRLFDTETRVSYQLVLPAGRWAIKLSHRKGPDAGVYRVLLDGEEVACINGLHPTIDTGEAWVEFPVPTTGRRHLQLAMGDNPGGCIGEFDKIDLKRIA